MEVKEGEGEKTELGLGDEWVMMLKCSKIDCDDVCKTMSILKPLNCVILKDKFYSM